MKIVLQIIFILLVPVCMSCNGSEVITGKPEAIITQFTLQCGGTYYRGNINNQSKVIRISGISSRKAVTGVNFKLSEGANISPDPRTVKRWEAEQQFIVTSSDNQATSEYTLLLPELQEDPEASPKVIIGYLPPQDFNFDTQFDNIHWEYLTHVNVCFANVKSNGTLNTNRVPADKLRKICAKAKEYGVKVLISINKNSDGEFAAAINDVKTRSELVANIVNFTQRNQLDGFDIDYEDYNHWDTNSLVAFAKALHDAKSEDMLMTCAVVSRRDYTAKWQEYFDYINIMSYDKVMGDSSIPGQHASYNHFVNDMNLWVSKYQTPKSKIVGGLPFYGYSWDDNVGKDEVGAIRFNGILNYYGKNYDLEQVADADQFGKTYYNGRPTIRKKCQYVLDNDFGGVMIWQLFQDAYQEEYKLINVIGAILSAN